MLQKTIIYAVTWLCLYVLRCYTTLNFFSQLIFNPHGLQNKIFPSVEKICTPNSETNDRIRAINELFFLLAF